ncbi:AraC family transcriptional regulator [Clostridium sp. DJ247]|nr:AraC family transcriptional regulator [Clostridium sp. DJ247]
MSKSVGYKDPLVFSKLFKKVKGVSPRNFRKLNI